MVHNTCIRENNTSNDDIHLNARHISYSQLSTVIKQHKPVTKIWLLIAYGTDKWPSPSWYTDLSSDWKVSTTHKQKNRNHNNPVVFKKKIHFRALRKLLYALSA